MPTHHFRTLFISYFFLLSSCFNSYPYATYEVYRFPELTWVENIAVRPNGYLLVTLVNKPQLWEINPHAPAQETRAKLIHHFEGAEMLTGITELTPDVYAVVASNTVWRVDLHNVDKQPVVSLIQKLDAGSLNGMTLLNGYSGTVAIADCHLGLVWSLDTNTGDYHIILQDESMAANTDIGPLLGINGVRVLGGYLYYVNTPRRLYCRVRVNPWTGHAVGPYEIVSHGGIPDDFALSEQGVGYIAGLTDNVVVRAFLNGTQEVIAGASNSSQFMTATSAAFGRNGDDHILYVTTGGETANMTGFHGNGKVMAVEVV